jgi:hypothetical protein
MAAGREAERRSGREDADGGAAAHRLAQSKSHRHRPNRSNG